KKSCCLSLPNLKLLLKKTKALRNLSPNSPPQNKTNTSSIFKMPNRKKPSYHGSKKCAPWYFRGRVCMTSTKNNNPVPFSLLLLIVLRLSISFPVVSDWVCAWVLDKRL